jgi:hypothetical protein
VKKLISIFLLMLIGSICVAQRENGLKHKDELQLANKGPVLTQKTVNNKLTGLQYIFKYDGCTIKLINNSDLTFQYSGLWQYGPNVTSDFKYDITPIEIPANNNPIEVFNEKCTSDIDFKGSLLFLAKMGNVTFKFVIDYDVPYIRGKINFVASAITVNPSKYVPFHIRRVNTVGGNHPIATFEIWGKTTDEVPIITIPIPATGKRSLRGSFTWDPDSDGMPPMNTGDYQKYLTSQVFSIQAFTPASLLWKTDNIGPDDYEYSPDGIVKKIKKNGIYDMENMTYKVNYFFSVIPRDNQHPEKGVKYKVLFAIDNLPDEVPIRLNVIIVPFWMPGKDSRKKPTPESYYFPIMRESFKDYNNVDYTISGAWITNQDANTLDKYIMINSQFPSPDQYLDQKL